MYRFIAPDQKRFYDVEQMQNWTNISENYDCHDFSLACLAHQGLLSVYLRHAPNNNLVKCTGLKRKPDEQRGHVPHPPGSWNS